MRTLAKITEFVLSKPQGVNHKESLVLWFRMNLSSWQLGPIEYPLRLDSIAAMIGISLWAFASIEKATW